jgi:hypothetical protein
LARAGLRGTSAVGRGNMTVSSAVSAEHSWMFSGLRCGRPCGPRRVPDQG